MKKIWEINWEDKAVKELKKLDKKIQTKIIDFLEQKISTNESPYRFEQP